MIEQKVNVTSNMTQYFSYAVEKQAFPREILPGILQCPHLLNDLAF